jgi:hypothetical protein
MDSAAGLIRASLVVFFVIVGSGAAFAQTPEPPQPVLDDDALFHKYVITTLGPAGALHATIASSFEQWRGSPEAWDKDTAGYAKRWASEFAESAIGNTTKYAVAHAFHQDPSFARCQCTGAARRVRHALTSPFMARTRDGRRVFSLATVSGITAENVIPASTWYPAPHGLRDGALHAAAGLMAKAGVNLVREFFPQFFPHRPAAR